MVFPNQSEMTTRGTRHYALPNRISDEPASPLYNAQTAAVGLRPGTVLPDCEKCDWRSPCLLRQRLNYEMNLFAFSFWLPDCEAALSGQVDLYDLVSHDRYAIADLARLTGKCYGTLWRELRLLRPRGINVVAYGPKAEALYGYGAPYVRPANRVAIQATLRENGPCITYLISEQTHLNVATVRRLLRDLEAAHEVTTVGKQKFITRSGIIRQAPLWQLL